MIVFTIFLVCLVGFWRWPFIFSSLWNIIKGREITMNNKPFKSCLLEKQNKFDRFQIFSIHLFYNISIDVLVQLILCLHLAIMPILLPFVVYDNLKTDNSDIKRSVKTMLNYCILTWRIYICFFN